MDVITRYLYGGRMMSALRTWWKNEEEEGALLRNDEAVYHSLARKQRPIGTIRAAMPCDDAHG
jgi:hypothetical protein